RYLQPLFNDNNPPDTLVLGCTHFPLLKPRIENYLGRNVSVIDSASNVAKEILHLLQQRELLSTENSKPTQFLVTDSPQRFITTAGIFLGKSLDERKVQHISV
ncbi:MAG: glutamate racemase, partial [Gammaproteobacteria bacterium]|nr:glutamate racemase [Gammaproteobacteria bacterium]